MNLPKIIFTSTLVCLTGMASSTLFAQIELQALSNQQLSTIYYDKGNQIEYDTARASAFRYRMYQIEQAIQTVRVDHPSPLSIDWQPELEMSDLAALSPGLQAYVENIANGLQSNDPSQGIQTMLDGFNNGVSAPLFGYFEQSLVQAELRDKHMASQALKSGVTEANRQLIR